MRRLSGRERALLAAILFAAAVGLWLAWRLFWYRTDDAYIAFRYVSNSMLGHGYVWNPPPFRPVEGYTSFLWIALLDVVWRVTGVEPPDSANPIALLFSAVTLAVVARLVLRMRWGPVLAPWRVGFVALVLAAVLTNRTFLAWTSSGLEFAMFDAWLMVWIAFCLSKDGTRRNLGLAASGALAALTRPEGILAAGASAALIVIDAGLAARRRDPWLRRASAAAPLLAVPAHLLWRRSFYGAWLPNTYHAKAVAGRFWIESGARYLLSFVIEYALWIWMAVALAAIGAVTVRFVRRRPSLRSAFEGPGHALGCAAVLGVLLVHLLTYTFRIGGDHFEYRVYSHLIPLVFVSFVWALDRLRIGRRLSVAMFVAFMACSWIIPWTHWAGTRGMDKRRDTHKLIHPVVPDLRAHVPWAPRWLFAAADEFDSMQGWLILHSVCMRHQEHDAFCRTLIKRLPTRAEGAAIDVGPFPVAATSSVGVVGWILPNVCILDTCGLNDWVIARNIDLRPSMNMAHERQPPPGYIERFRPNVTILSKRVEAEAREVELTADEIVAAERDYAALLTRGPAAD